VGHKHTDLTVASPGVQIAVRDWGGSGSGLILIHGLSRTMADWNVIAASAVRYQMANSPRLRLSSGR